MAGLAQHHPPSVHEDPHLALTDLPRSGSVPAISASSNGSSANLHQKIPKILICLADCEGMTRVDTTPATGRQDPDCDGPLTHEAGIPPVVITVVEAPACHLCEDAKSALAVLAQSFPMTVHVLSVSDAPGRALMDQHRAPMSPLVLLDGEYFSSGRLPRRKLERRLSKAMRGETNG